MQSIEPITTWFSEPGNAAFVASLIGGLTLIVAYFSLRKRGEPKSKPGIENKGPGNAATTGGDIHQTTIIHGYTIEQHEERLKAREAEIRQEVQTAHDKERSQLEAQLDEVRRQQADIETSYGGAVKKLELLEPQLEVLREQFPAEKLEAATAALTDGDTARAGVLFDELLLEADRAKADLAFSRGLVAELDLDWIKAAESFALAANLRPTSQHLREASTYARLAGKYEEALAFANQLLDLSVEDSVNKAAALTSKAQAIDALGRHGEAEPLLREALALLERLLGKEHPDTASSLNNLASNLDDKGLYEQAEPLYREALELRERLLGKEHPDTAQSLNNLAYNLNAQGLYEQAEPLFREALELRERLLGKAHPDTAVSLNNLAYNLDAQGLYEQAEPLYREALELTERLLGKEHPSTATSLNNLASNLDDQGLYEQAEPLFREAYDLLSGSLGPDHPNSKIVKGNLNRFLEKIGKPPIP